MGRTTKLANAVRDAWLMIDGAREAAAAVTARRMPSAQSLRKLGIDPDEANRLSL